MSYIVLARKYRPQNFSELKGQDVLVQTVANALKFGKLHHAYLLTGIRGIGKTTTARIMAKTVNCENPANTETIITPCEECSNCKSVKNGSHPDVIEFDAASNTGIDEIKTMLEGISYAPALGKYRVFIVDEVHMLSNKAFNSLLKTLEEPPQHVIFIFATTEIQKVPVTILSRCQKFVLAPLTNEKMQEHLLSVAAKENIKIQKEALELIASKSGGSVRDALSMLDQAVTQSPSGEISFTVVQSMLSVVSGDDIAKIYKTVTDGSSVEQVLNALQAVKAYGVDEFSIMEEFLHYLYSQVRESIAQNRSYSNLLRLWNIFLHSMNDLQIAVNKYAALEMIFIKAMHTYSSPSVENLVHGISEGRILEILKDFPGAEIMQEK